jgi:hypothetical protein
MSKKIKSITVEKSLQTIRTIVADSRTIFVYGDDRVVCTGIEFDDVSDGSATVYLKSQTLRQKTDDWENREEKKYAELGIFEVNSKADDSRVYTVHVNDVIGYEEFEEEEEDSSTPDDELTSEDDD